MGAGDSGGGYRGQVRHPVWTVTRQLWTMAQVDERPKGGRHATSVSRPLHDLFPVTDGVSLAETLGHWWTGDGRLLRTGATKEEKGKGGGVIPHVPTFLWKTTL